MKKYITIVLQIQGKPLKEVSIESADSLHELEIYSMLAKLVPTYISVNFDDESTQEGYSYTYLNGLQSVAICRH